MDIDLAFIWAAIIAFAVLAYVILDGFDLGIGILFPLFPHKHDKDVMMNSVAPVWDGNETRSEEHTSELQSLMRISYAVFCLYKKNMHKRNNKHHNNYIT